MKPKRSDRRVSPIGGWALALGHCLLASLSLRFTRYEGGAAFVWLAGPLLFAGVTAAHRRRRLPLALISLPGMILASLVFGLGWRVAVPLSLADIGEAYAAAWLVRRAYPRFGKFSSAREIFFFVAIAGFAVPAVVALFGALFVSVVTHMPYWAVWRDWFIAHAVGLIAFGPPMTLILGGQMRRWASAAGRRKTLEAVAILSAVAATAVATFGQSRVPLLAVPFLPMMLATLRLGRFGAVTSVVILIAIASIYSVAGIGPTTMIHGGMGLRLQILQIYFATVVLVILPTAGELRARRRIYERLRAAEAINRLMLDHSSDIILRLGLDGVLRYVSPSIRRYDGVSPDALIGQRLETLVHDDSRDDVAAAHDAALRSPEEIVPVEWQSHKLSQPPRWFEAHARAIVDERGSPTGVVYVVRDVTERKLLGMELEVRANTDPLTGLANRRAFDVALDAAIAAAEVSPAYLAMFDLDHFKTVNDGHGHASGDLMLRRFAGILKANIRDGDITARMGGEEFAIILRDVDDKAASAICERIRFQLSDLTVTTAAGAQISLTVSVGLSRIFSRAAKETLFERADQALYAAKRSGRNRLAVAA